MFGWGLAVVFGGLSGLASKPPCHSLGEGRLDGVRTSAFAAGLPTSN